MSAAACHRFAPAATVRVIAAVVVVAVAAVVAGAGCGSSPSATDGGDGAREVTFFDVPPLGDASVAGYALSFDGINDYATTGNAGFPQAGSEQTIAMWVNYRAAAATQDFFAMRTDFVAGVQIGIRDGTITVWRTFSSRTLVAAPSLPAVNKWHHVAYTFDRTTHILYIDGVMVASSTAASDTRTPSQAWLGTVDGSTELFTGLMDEVRVWTVVRAPAEIVKDMLHRMPGPEPGLVAYWTFDDAQSGGHSLDLTGGGDDVTLGDGIAERMPSRVLSDAPVGP